MRASERRIRKTNASQKSEKNKQHLWQMQKQQRPVKQGQKNYARKTNQEKTSVCQP